MAKHAQLRSTPLGQPLRSLASEDAEAADDRTAQRILDADHGYADGDPVNGILNGVAAGVVLWVLLALAVLIVR